MSGSRGLTQRRRSIFFIQGLQVGAMIEEDLYELPRIAPRPLESPTDREAAFGAASRASSDPVRCPEAGSSSQAHDTGTACTR